MREGALDKRLYSAAQFVRQDAVFADIGTDHAYLPIFLLREGRIRRAFCSDVNEGPLNKAKENAIDSGIVSGIEFYLTDGAAELSGKGITDFAICGMGGELIARIIAECDFLRERGIRLILQPMTRHAALRRALYLMGYRPVAEHYSVADGKSYVTFVYEYSSVSLDLDPVTEEFGEREFSQGEREDVRAYLLSRRKSLSRTLSGKRTSGRDTAREAALLYEIDLRLSELRTF